jgi:hypothetical protein
LAFTSAIFPAKKEKPPKHKKRKNSAGEIEISHLYGKWLGTKLPKNKYWDHP